MSSAILVILSAAKDLVVTLCALDHQTKVAI